MKPRILIPALACAGVLLTGRVAKETVVAMVGIYLITEHLIIHRRKA